MAGVELPFADDLTVPELFPYPLEVPSPPAVDDIERAARDAVLATFGDTVTDGMTIAVGAGSRGLTGRVELLRGTIAALRQLGADPFVVPAMGSHGGATAEGQVHLLAELGMTEQSLDAEIRATMDTIVVAHTDSGTPVHLDANAAAADRFLPVNRIKPHTCFKGPIESGCMKMAVVGFGKQPGASLVHSCGPIEMRDRLLDACAALRSTGKLLGRHRFDRVDVRRRCSDRRVGCRRRGHPTRTRTHRVLPCPRAVVAVRADRRVDRRARRQGHLGHHDRPERHRPVLGAGPRRPCASRR